MWIDLNADVGEGFGPYRAGDDAVLLEVVSSANVACGFHAGDPLLLDTTVERAVRLGVAVGAHPSYPDLLHFGRVELRLPPEEVAAHVVYQIGAVAAFCRRHGAGLRHVKPHGALYHAAAADPVLAAAVAQAVASVGPELVLFAPPGSRLAAAGTAAGLRVAVEGFADRAYGADGRLLPRGQPGALLTDAAAAAAQALRLAQDGGVQTLCVHSDTPGAARIARAVREALLAAGMRLAPPDTWLPKPGAAAREEGSGGR
ncbi:MAG: LamB/YcsF family protein [Clostridia bacterium]|nr:LamB/YcsF family protein [Clostridia bacterium]